MKREEKEKVKKKDEHCPETGGCTELCFSIERNDEL